MAELKIEKGLPPKICTRCGAKIYTSGKIVFCPKCKRPWKNPIRKRDNPKRNPSTQTVGNILGGLSILTVPLFIGFIIWANNKYGKEITCVNDNK